MPSSTLVYFKKSAFALELPRGRSPLCPRPRSGLFPFPLQLENRSEIAHGAERVGMLCAQLRFAACERFALQLCGLAARGGAAGAALQTSNASVRQFVLSVRYANYRILYRYQYQSHSFRGLPTSTRKLVVGCSRNSLGGPGEVIRSVGMHYIYHRPDLQEFTLKI